MAYKKLLRAGAVSSLLFAGFGCNSSVKPSASAPVSVVGTPEYLCVFTKTSLPVSTLTPVAKMVETFQISFPAGLPSSRLCNNDTIRFEPSAEKKGYVKLTIEMGSSGKLATEFLPGKKRVLGTEMIDDTKAISLGRSLTCHLLAPVGLEITAEK